MSQSDIILAILLALLITYIWLDKVEDVLEECGNDTKSIVYYPYYKKVFETSIHKPLSTRNNNPINIKRVKGNNWIGSDYKRGLFESFSNPRLGIRASLMVINSNIMATNSVKEFVDRIVSKEKSNPVEMYTKHLEYQIGYKGKIKKSDNVKILRAMIFLEGGAEAVEYFEEYLECSDKLN